MQNLKDKLENVINMIPSGEARNILCDINIELQTCVFVKGAKAYTIEQYSKLEHISK